MKYLITIFLILFFIINICAEQLFIDYFDNISKIDTNFNTIISSGNIIISNIVDSTNGFLISSLITRQSNHQWDYLNADYHFTNTANGFTKITFSILDQNNTQLASETVLANSGKTKSSIYLNYGIIRDQMAIKLKANFQSGSTFDFGTPFLHSWDVSVNLIDDADTNPVHSSFYGTPAPLKIDTEQSSIRFRYKIAKNCKVTLKIYDTNYNLIRTIAEEKSYTTGENLKETWDGKNGKYRRVMSGVYIAILKINNTDGSKTDLDPFIFAVIR